MAKNVNTTNKTFHNQLSDYTSVTNTSISGSALSGGGYTIGAGAAGAAYNWTSGLNGTSALNYSNMTISASNPAILNQSGMLQLNGDNADIEINGRSLMDAIETLEQRLNILVPNPKLEKEWDELRELGERYRELEKQCKEKGEMWKKLKTVPPGLK